MTVGVAAVIAMIVGAIVAAEKIPQTLTALIRACVPLAHALRELIQAARDTGRAKPPEPPTGTMP